MSSILNMLLPVAVGLLMILLSVLLRPEGRHRRYIRRAEGILEKLQGMEDGQVIACLKDINPYVFEELVLCAFEKKGAKVARNRRYSGDGGVDGKVRIDGKTVLIQCKRYRNHIRPKHVRDFAEICRKCGREGYFVHTGRTGRGARAESRLGPVTLVSGSRLVRLVKGAEADRQERT